MSTLRRSDLFAVAALALFALLIAASIVLGGRFDGDGTRAGSCERGMDLQQCEEARVEVESALKNAATAQESYAVSNEGRYTDRLSDLEAEGLQLGPRIEVTIARAGRDGYCLEATAGGLVGAMHYSSTEGAPLPGRC